MPVDSAAPIRISAFAWVPDFARGQVRDLRVRWALEEAGLDYSVRKLDAAAERPADYFEEQPFGQVPSYREGDFAMFESGAIVLHIGERSEALLPADPEGRARATTWVLAALNSIEPSIQQLVAIDIFHAGEEWTAGRRPEVVRMIRSRLQRLSDALGEREWLEDRFTAGDLIMVSVLRILHGNGLVEDYPNLAAYRARGEARPAFQRALAAQLADFEERKDPVAA